METTYVGQQKLIVRGARHFRITEESADAAVQAEWADKVLAQPAVTYPNGRNSHEAAGAVLDAAEDILLDHLVIVAEGIRAAAIEPDTRGAGIKATWHHDAGAYARCHYCGRYSDNPKSLARDEHPCDCGKVRGWCGSFKAPTSESKWSEAS